MIELRSDLGGGKTTLTRGLVSGAGSIDPVSSPTFTVSKLYNTPRLTIYHFDFYRLQEAGLMAHELHDALQDTKGVVIVEWGDVVGDVLPEERVIVTIRKTDDGGRQIDISTSESFGYLLA